MDQCRVAELVPANMRLTRAGRGTRPMLTGQSWRSLHYGRQGNDQPPAVIPSCSGDVRVHLLLLKGTRHLRPARGAQGRCGMVRMDVQRVRETIVAGLIALFVGLAVYTALGLA